ncbi:hypothetical protein AKJ37_05595 [candidate division MSBL1 archaeon SCGC-AAA259I09]|uniref:Sodium:solute symporter n=1 Tax=candidate division MSBL1 archaeon SCGC-AAA259I09 TaxID=1698267 RepID=A0A133UQ22_9EURY|nr:hypothetical protein AKJ37_05595 [candidate division MSBL1 archaeon SCGC-AAA259I09]
MALLQTWTSIWIICIFVIILGIGFFARKEIGSLGDFLVAGRNMGPIIVAGAFMATWYSAGAFIGIPSIAGSAGYPAVWLLGFCTTATIPLVAYYVPIKLREFTNKHGVMGTGEFVGTVHNSRFVSVLAGLVVIVFFSCLYGSSV